MEQKPPNFHVHEFVSGKWGIIIGISACKCGHIATKSDFKNECIESDVPSWCETHSRPMLACEREKDGTETEATTT